MKRMGRRYNRCRETADLLLLSAPCARFTTPPNPLFPRIRCCVFCCPGTEKPSFSKKLGFWRLASVRRHALEESTEGAKDDIEQREQAEEENGAKEAKQSTGDVVKGDMRANIAHDGDAPDAWAPA
jgi:hypothetical protein